MKKLTKKSRDELSNKLNSVAQQGADAVIEHAAAETSPEYLPDLIAHHALHRGLIENDESALWAGLQQSVRLRFALKKPEHYHSGSYGHFWDIIPVLVVGDAKVFSAWLEHVPARLTEGNKWVVAMSNAVTAIGRKDQALKDAARSEVGRRLATRSLGKYDRATLEILSGALRGDAALVARGVDASVRSWARHFGSNRWRLDWFLAIDALALFNLARTLIETPIAMPEHERWRIPPTLNEARGDVLLDFSERLPIVDKWCREFPKLADPSEWGSTA